MQTKAQAGELRRINEIVEPFAQIERSFIQNDLKQVVAQGESMSDVDNLVRQYGVVAASVARIIMATPNSEEKLYRQAIDGAQTVIDRMMGTSDQLELSVLAKAHLVEAHAIIGLRQDADKQLRQAAETLPGIQIASLKMALEQMVRLSEAQGLIRNSGEVGRATKLVEQARTVIQVPFYGAYRSMVQIELRLGEDYWTSLASPAEKGHFDLAFFSIFLPVSDRAILLRDA